MSLLGSYFITLECMMLNHKLRWYRDNSSLRDKNYRVFIMFRDRNRIKPPAMRVRPEKAIALREK